MSDASFENLISAYLDDELGPVERAQAEKLIAEDAEMASLRESLLAHSRQLKSLPRYKLDDQFADRVMDTAAFKEAFVATTSSERVASRSAAATGKPKSWRAAAIAIGSLAALILVTLLVDPTQVVKDSSVAATAEFKKSVPAAEPAFGPDDGAENSFDEEDSGIASKGNSPLKAGENDASHVSKATPYQQQPVAVNEETIGEPSMGLSKGNAKAAKKMDDDSDQQTVELDRLADVKAKPNELAHIATQQRGLKAPPGQTAVESELRQGQIAALMDAQTEKSVSYYQDAASIQQVIEVTFPAKSDTDKYDIGDLPQALADNRIVLENDDMKKPSDEHQQEKIGGIEISRDSRDSEALYIVTSPAKMRGLISELAAKNARVSAYEFSVEDQMSPSMNLPDPVAAQTLGAFGFQNQPGNANSSLALKEQNPVQELAQIDQPAARVLGAEIVQDALSQPKPAQNKKSQKRSVPDGTIEGANAGGLVAETSQYNGSKSRREMPSIARRFSKKSELTFNESNVEPGLRSASEKSKSGARLRDGGRGAGAGLGEANSDAVGDRGNANQGKDLTAQPSEAEIRNIERINRFFGIQSGADGDDQTPRRYLLFVRQEEQSADKSIIAAPAMNVRPEPVDK